LTTLLTRTSFFDEFSKSTADLLIAAGKERWLRPRREKVTAKGKGTMDTFWLEMDGVRAPSTSKTLPEDSSHRDVVSNVELMSSGAKKQESRLIGWMTEVLLDYVKQIVSST